jgi:hypothetical protein
MVTQITERQMNAVAAALAPQGATLRTPELLGWAAILDCVASEVFRRGAPLRAAVRPYLFDLLMADAEYDYEVTTSKEFRDAVNAFAAGTDVNWNAIMPELLLRYAARSVRSGLESR